MVEFSFSVYRSSSRGVLLTIGLLLLCSPTTSLIPLIDGGKVMPKLYDGWFNDQIAKQACTGISKALAAGKTKIEVNFPPVPNVEEVKFGTPLNQKFGQSVVAKDLGVAGGYKPGSDVSRQLIAFSNMYWAKKIAPAVKGGLVGGKAVAALTSEPVTLQQLKKMGDVSRTGAIMSPRARKESRKGEAIIYLNPGGEESWDRIVSAHTSSPSDTVVMLNNAYSTTYDLGNKRGYEEAYYLKRISKGWVFRTYPGPWEAYLEKPDGSVEMIRSYKTKPSLQEVAKYVREESFKKYAIFNDRWSKGFGERL